MALPSSSSSRNKKLLHERHPPAGSPYSETESRSVGWPLHEAMSSKSLSRCKTVKPVSSAVAAIRRSGIEGDRWRPRSASNCCSSIARTSMEGVRYVVGMSVNGALAFAERKSEPDRAEKPTSSRVMDERCTSPRSIRLAHSAASGLWASRMRADLSINHAVIARPLPRSPHRQGRRTWLRTTGNRWWRPRR